MNFILHALLAALPASEERELCKKSCSFLKNKKRLSENSEDSPCQKAKRVVYYLCNKEVCTKERRERLSFFAV